MNNKIAERLADLRQYMEQKGMHAFIVPSTDAHLSEYPATHWCCRKWISGFTGSAGTFVITREKSGLWTDSRYFLQAANELEGTEIQLFKEGLPATPGLEEWLLSELNSGEYVGIDGNVYAAKDAMSLTHKLNGKGLHIISDYDPFASIWKNRPQIPDNPIYSMPEKLTGESASSKINRICDAIEKEGAQSLLVASLDTIAWIFNIRSNDVKCNPVAISYAYVSRKQTVLFINPKKLNENTSVYLKEQGIMVADYEKVTEFVSKINHQTICLDGHKVSFKLYNAIPDNCQILDMPSPADWMKSIKNETELKNIREAMEHDGRALVQFLMWLENALPKGISELDVSNRLFEFRDQQSNFVGESFDTIAGYGPNGAIVHYKVTPESSLPLKQEGFLLLDSGGQYFNGTTDITRTIALGPLTDEMKKDYTLVLKGHIGIATALFPQGTRGNQIDILARKNLWENGLNYLHGTGHGVGYFLNVHEGPQSIRTDNNPTPLHPGMITSNEPGLYRAGKHGIRIENLIHTQKVMEGEFGEFGEFYGFETLSLCPIDTKPILKELLCAKEIEWLNKYHQMVYNRVSPLLDETEKAWLKEKTKAF